jgi:hypothetical protein
MAQSAGKYPHSYKVEEALRKDRSRRIKEKKLQNLYTIQLNGGFGGRCS